MAIVLNEIIILKKIKQTFFSTKNTFFKYHNLFLQFYISVKFFFRQTPAKCESFFAGNLYFFKI